MATEKPGLLVSEPSADHIHTYAGPDRPCLFAQGCRWCGLNYNRHPINKYGLVSKGFDSSDTIGPNDVIAPLGSGCDGLIGFAFKKLRANEPKAVMGLFDPPARAGVKADLLRFSIPWPKFVTMLENMDDCFLNTYICEKIQKLSLLFEIIYKRHDLIL